MNADRAALKALADQRGAIEAEMAAVAARLNAPGMPGEKSPLVDAEGFPLADVDVHAIRTDRHRLAVLKTDHARLSAALEKGLHALHAAARAAASPSTPSPPGAAAARASAPSAAAAAAPPAATNEPKRARLDTDESPPQPQPQPQPQPSVVAFALVDEVSDASPAAAAGLQVGDALLSLAGVQCSGGDARALAAAMAALGPAVGTAEGRAVGVTVLRRGERLALTLTPRRWEGRGLLGCHLRPLS